MDNEHVSTRADDILEVPVPSDGGEQHVASVRVEEIPQGPANFATDFRRC